jgi:PST family polysaccharide transporter
VIATLTFAPLVIAMFYTAKFAEAVDVLRWICLGIALRVITWPMGYIIVAKNKQVIFFAAELAWTIVNVGLTWICVRAFGLNGAGIAFFGSYVFHALMVYPIVRGLTGFRWSIENGRTVLLFVLSIGFVFCGFYVMPSLPATGIGALAMVISGIYSIRVLIVLIPVDHLPRSTQRLLVLFRSARAGS